MYCPNAHPSRFSLSYRNGDLTQSVHRLRPVGGHLPCPNYEITTLATLLPTSNSCTLPSQGPHPSVSAELIRCIMCDTPHGGYAPHPDRPNGEGCRQDRRPFPLDMVPLIGAVTHPHFNRLFRGLMSSRRRSNGPADVIAPIWRCHCSPEPTLYTYIIYRDNAE